MKEENAYNIGVARAQMSNLRRIHQRNQEKQSDICKTISQQYQSGKNFFVKGGTSDHG